MTEKKNHTSNPGVGCDVIEVYAPEGTKTLFPEIHHIENAFSV